MELKVRLLDGVAEKGVAQVEQELLQKHEQEFNNEVAPSVNEVAPERNNVEDDLDEQKVLSYIGKRYNKQINSFDELVSERKESEELPEDVASFLKYK